MSRLLPVLLATLLAACAGRTARPQAPTPGAAATTRADDLAARARATPPAAAGNGNGAAEARPGTGGPGGPYALRSTRECPGQSPGGGEADAHADACGTIDLGEIKLVVTGHDASGDPHIEAVSPQLLLDQAQAEIDAGRPQRAIAALARLASEFPSSPLAPSAMFNIGRLYEEQADVVQAIAAYRELVARYPTGRESLDGHLRIAGLQAEHEQWSDAARTLAEILARTDLAHADRLEAQARLGYVQLESGDRTAARASLEAAIATWRKAQRIDDHYYIAMAYFYLGELEHRAFAELPLRPADDALKADLAAREAAAARAYDQWKDALLQKDPYWSSAAGYEMSQIFVELWESAVRAPFPDGLSADARPYYVTEVHERVRRHLQTALEGHQMNVKLAAAYGADNAWSRASALKAGEILGILSREAKGEAVVPPVASAIAP